MKVDAKALAAHLARIYLSQPGGADGAPAGIRDAVLFGRWECAAQSGDGSVIVRAPRLADADPLPEEIGIPDLLTLIAALRMRTFEGEVDISFEETHLVLRKPGEQRPSIHLLLAAPDDIYSRLKPAAVEKIFSSLPNLEGIPVNFLPWDERLREVELKENPIKSPAEVGAIHSLLGSETIALEVGPKQKKDCRWLLIGEKGQWGQIRHHYKAPTKYTLTFHSAPLLALLRVIREAPDPCIHLLGKAERLVFSDRDGFRWLIKPKESTRKGPRYARPSKAEDQQD